MRWNIKIFKKVLPRHFEIILLIDYFFMENLKTLKMTDAAVERL
jgi:glucan phosphorylase